MIWILIAGCVVISFAFSGAEAGILSLNRVRLRHRLNAGDREAIRLNRLVARPERLLVTVLLVTNAMNICAVALTTTELVRLLGRNGYLWSLLLCLPAYLFVFEALPKTLFRRFPYRALARLSAPLAFADWLLAPVLLAVTKFGALIFPLEQRERRRLFAAREEFKYFTLESERAGMLTTSEREMIHRVVDFRAVTVRDICLPLARVIHGSADGSLDEALALARAHQLDDLPIRAANGELVGVVNVLDALLDRTPQNSVGKHLRRLVAVREDKSGYEALRRMRAARARVAGVTDAQGMFTGLVTADDLIRRLIAPPSP